MKTIIIKKIIKFLINTIAGKILLLSLFTSLSLLVVSVSQKNVRTVDDLKVIESTVKNFTHVKGKRGVDYCLLKLDKMPNKELLIGADTVGILNDEDFVSDFSNKQVLFIFRYQSENNLVYGIEKKLSSGNIVYLSARGSIERFNMNNQNLQLFSISLLLIPFAVILFYWLKYLET